MKDRVMQAWYLLALEPIAEATADKHSYGFRPERSAAPVFSRPSEEKRGTMDT